MRDRPNSAAPRPGRTSAAAWTTLAIFIVLYLLSFFDRQILALLLLSIQRDLDLSDVQLGAIVGLAFSLFYAVLGLALGWAIDRYSKKWLMFCGVVIWSMATVACGLAHSFGQLFAARLMVGFGEAVVGPAAFVVLTSIFPRERLGLVMGVYTSGSPAAAGIVFIGGGAMVAALNAHGGMTLPLVGALKPWQAAFVMIGGPGALLALLSFLIVEPPRRADPTIDASGRPVTLGGFLRANRKIFSIHIAAFTLVCMSAYAVIAWAPVFLGRVYHWGPAKIGLMVGVSYGLLGVAGNIVWGSIADHQVRRGRTDGAYLTYCVALACGLPIAMATFLIHSPVGVAIGLCALWPVMLSTGGLQAPIGVIAPPHLRGRIYALVSLSVAIFSIGLTPVLVGTLTDKVFRDHDKVGASIATVILVCTLSALFLLWFGRRALREAVERLAP